MQAAGNSPDPVALGQVAAVRLFVQRAQAVRPEFALSPEQAPAVAALCRRLDGLPLAIELAAARVGSLAVEAIAARLDDRFKLLTTGPRTAPARQQTLRGALDWSWALLAPRERTLLARLAAFAGGWTLEAAATVCAGTSAAAGAPESPHAAGLDEWDVLDGLEELVTSSLVQVSEAGEAAGAARYSLLETVREYAALQLQAGGEGEAVRDRHLAWCLALAEAAEPALRGPEQQAWLERLETEHDNLRAALSWARERAAREEGLRLVGALWRFWAICGYYGEGRGWLETALTAGVGDWPAARARALHGAGALAYHVGEYARAATLYEEALAQRRTLGDTRGMATALGNLGWVTYLQDQYERAAALTEEALALYRTLGEQWGIAGSLGNLGVVALAQGEYGRAVALQEEALALYRTLGDQFGFANTLVNLAWVLQAQGEYERAEAALRESLPLSREMGAREMQAEALECLAWLAVAAKQALRAARLSGAAEALREELGQPLVPILRAGHERAGQAMRNALGEGAFAAAWTEGRHLPPAEAVALALADAAE